MNPAHRCLQVAVILVLVTPTACKGTSSPLFPGGPMHGILVLSDQVEDLSSLEAIHDHLQGLSDKEKAEEIFRLGVKFRHQSTPPLEHLGPPGGHVHDPIKILNVYGYCQCDCASAMLTALARENDIPARGWSLAKHSVAEVKYDDSWHMYDISLINWFLDDAGRVAGVMDMMRLQESIINAERSPFIGEDGYLPARVQRLDPGNLGDYVMTGSHVHEWRYTLGHRMGMSLRRGESLVRRWSNIGLHVNRDRSHDWDPPMDSAGPVGSQIYLEDFYPGYRMGLVGNGTLSYEPDLASGDLAAGALSMRNIALGGDPPLRLASEGSGEVILPITSPYVFLDGEIRGSFMVEDRSSVRVSLSFNHGLEWREIWSATEGGSIDAAIDLGPHILRRYQYLARIEVEGAAAVSALSFHHDIQHSQRALPSLSPGRNRITVKAPDPALATRSITASLADSGGLNSHIDDFRPIISNMSGAAYLNRNPGRTGAVTIPVRAPGEIRTVRFGGTFRCQDEDGTIRLVVSDDGGDSWKEAQDRPCPLVDYTEFVTFDAVDPETREVLVRYEFNGNEKMGMFSFRIDVDYVDPRAGTHPVEVTYEWIETEGGARSHSRIIESFPATYTIDVAGEPLMKQVAIRGL